MSVSTLTSCVGFGALAMSLLLIVYLDLRLHALKQSGGLSGEAPQLIRLRWDRLAAIIDMLQTLYSRPYRRLESHTLRLVPIIRVLYPLGLGLIVISAVSGVLGR